ncbi:MAG: hypothetical protein EA369_04885 [Bradymonadales bacterium]|nr:MAG: hypothetical protein EA369_04885 [Bradymonadales bacterium]
MNSPQFDLKDLPPSSFGLSEPFEWQALPGDASVRRYVRLTTPSGSRILMILNEREAFKSEEFSASSHVPESKEMDFVAIGRDWKKQGIRVPEIFLVSEEPAFVVLEDLGSRLLFDERSSSARIRHYQEALRELAKIQALKPMQRIKSRRFNQELWDWELKHFFEYAIEKRQKQVEPEALEAFKRCLQDAGQRVLAQTACVLHRDYHSKNLMILDSGGVGVIDFQDALWGPPTYDLASLLRDSYVRLSDAEEAELLDFFEHQIEEKLDRELFVWTSIQRNLKAVGRFYYISLVKQKDTHLSFVAPSLRRIIQSFEELGQETEAQWVRSNFSEEMGD